MSTTPLACYSFIPWLRRGVASRFTRVDGTMPAEPEPRATLTFGMGFNQGALGSSLSLSFAGPGEVGGLDPRAVIRCVPERDVHDAEPNYVAALEVVYADLPWSRTPARATAEGRLTPWCALICLAEAEITAYRAAGGEDELAVVRVADSSLLPRWDQLWAWTHAQLSGDKSPTPEELADILENEPLRLIARFLCPRRLDPRTAYRAFLVPSFERGRLAGLGREVAETLDGLAPAWDGATQNLDLPVLYEWRFQTGVAEDFEYLVRQLKPFVVPEDVGRRDMSVLDPGLGLPHAAAYPLALEGALKAVGSKSTDWKADDKQMFVTSLAALLNLSDDSLSASPGVTRPDAPVVAPTLYGRWHALQKRLSDAAGALPKWFHQLNADPRLRVAAGLGALVVQQQQRQLMASAWEQVGPIREINDERGKKQFARLSANRIYERHWKALDPESALAIAGPVLSRIKRNPRTVLAALRSSPIAPAMLDPQFRRLARPLGPMGRRQGREELRQAPSLLARINRGELAPRRQPPNPSGILTPRVAGLALTTRHLPRCLIRFLARMPWWALLLVALPFLVLFALGLLPLVPLVVVGIVFSGVTLLRQRSGDLDRRFSLVDGTLASEQVQFAPARRNFAPTTTPAVGGPPPPPSRASAGSVGASQATRLFRQAAAKALASARKAPIPGTDLVALDIPAVAATVIRALDPNQTIMAGVKERLRTKPGLILPGDPIDRVMAAPEFPQPMYEPLRDLGQDWLLPGLEKVPANSICLLETNQAFFVEPYMLGLSHEMARELLWNEYPTDQRGTYFRQFWDVRGYAPPSGETMDPEKVKDITPIHTWRQTSELGANSSRQLLSGAKQLVLLVRGDLLRRYPNTIIFAARATIGSDGRRTLGSEERHPLFRGTLKPDVTFFGFDLTDDQARGSTTPSGDPGWFFVLQEQPAEPRFGLDLPQGFGSAPGSWNELSWSHLAVDEAGLKAIKYIDLAAPLPNTGALETDPTGPVWHVAGARRGSRSFDLACATLQVPVRIAIHASDMLPAAGGGTPQ